MARPRIEIKQDLFESLCGLQCTLEEIAGVLGCSEDTVERWCKRTYSLGFADAYKKHSARGKMSLRRAQFRLAEKSAAMAIFLGKNCPEALGDYFAGPNHTLPTGGTARFSSPLSVDDFVKKSQFTYYTADALAKVAPKVDRFAREEGLDAHAKSAVVRSKKP